MLAVLRRSPDLRRGLSGGAKIVMEVLENNSPISTKGLKRAADLQGRTHETEYNRAMKELFSRLLIVGFGEFEDESVSHHLRLGRRSCFSPIYGCRRKSCDRQTRNL